MKLLTLFVLVALSAEGARLKDIATLKGARSNQLIGYGVVVGLPGTGDKASDLTENSLSQVLKNMGVDLKTQKIDSKNTAAVVVSSTLPPFGRMGSTLDVSVAAIGTATQLDGGTLMMTSLRGVDGKIYAMAHGKILALKRENKGGGGAGQASPPSWLVPGGATIEKENDWDFSQSRELKYQLLTPDFTTAVRVSKRINDELGGKYATATDAGTIDIIYPYTYDGNPVELIAQVEGVEVETDRRAKVVVNSRTGTVVLGDQVRIAAVAIAHANLKVEVSPEAAPPEPAAAPPGKTDPAKGAGKGEAKAGGEEKEGGSSKTKKLVLMDQGSTINEIVSGLNDMGASSDDLIALLQALKNAGALMAEVEMQ